MRTLLTVIILIASIPSPQPPPPKQEAIHYVEETEPPHLGRLLTLPPPADSEVRQRTPRDRGELLSCIRQSESGGNYSRISDPGMCRGGDRRCYGAYQWNQSVWINNFGDRSPAEVSAEEQDDLAWDYYQRRGLQPWSVKVRSRCS